MYVSIQYLWVCPVVPGTFDISPYTDLAVAMNSDNMACRYSRVVWHAHESLHKVGRNKTFVASAARMQLTAATSPLLQWSLVTGDACHFNRLAPRMSGIRQ